MSIFCSIIVSCSLGKEKNLAYIYKYTMPAKILQNPFLFPSKSSSFMIFKRIYVGFGQLKQAIWRHLTEFYETGFGIIIFFSLFLDNFIDKTRITAPWLYASVHQSGWGSWAMALNNAE